MLRDVLETMKEEPLIIYHWDPDPLISTILALAYATSPENAKIMALDKWKPNTTLLQKIAVMSRDAGSVALLGTGWSGGEIDALATMVLAPVAVLENKWRHLTPRRPNVIYYNPSPRGDRMGSVPSLSSILSMGLGHPHPLLAAAGIVSVMGDIARSNKLYQSLMAMAGLDHNSDYDIAWNCSMQAYGVTSMGDPGIHGGFPKSIVEADRDPCRAMLKDALLTSLRGMAEVALENAIRSSVVKEGDDIIVVEVVGEGRHAYFISRWFALQYRDKTVLTIYSDSSNGDLTACAWNVSSLMPLARLLPFLRGRGYEVVGSHHGSVNYVCFSKKASRRDLIEDFLRAYQKISEN